MRPGRVFLTVLCGAMAVVTAAYMLIWPPTHRITWILLAIILIGGSFGVAYFLIGVWNARRGSERKTWWEATGVAVGTFAVVFTVATGIPDPGIPEAPPTVGPSQTTSTSGPTPTGTDCHDSLISKLEINLPAKRFDELLGRAHDKSLPTSSKESAVWLWSQPECWVVRAVVERQSDDHAVRAFSITSLGDEVTPIMPITAFLSDDDPPRLRRTTFADLPFFSPVHAYGEGVTPKGAYYFGQASAVGAGVNQTIAVIDGSLGGGSGPVGSGPPPQDVINSFTHPCGELPCPFRTKILKPETLHAALTTWVITTVSIFDPESSPDSIPEDQRDLLREPLREEL